MITIEDLGAEEFLAMFRENRSDSGRALRNTFHSGIIGKYHKKRKENKITHIEYDDAIQSVYFNLVKAIHKFQGDNFLCLMKFCQNTIKYSYMQMSSENIRKQSTKVISLEREVYENVELINYIKKPGENQYDRVIFETMIEDSLGDKLCSTQLKYLIEASRKGFCVRTFAEENHISYEYARKLKFILRKKLIYVDGEIRFREE